MTEKEIPEFTEKDKARFWSLVDKESSEKGCWLWTGSRFNSGYGRLKVGGRSGKTLLAHRVSFILSGGTFENGPLVLHGPCNNKLCVNFDHLSAGTSQRNAQDRERDGTMMSGDRNWTRRFPEKLPRGDQHWSRRNPEKIARGDRSGSRLHPERLRRGDAHPARLRPEIMSRGEAHYRAKLTTENVIEIRRRAASGERYTDLGRAFGVTDVLIGLIVRRKSWKHV